MERNKDRDDRQSQDSRSKKKERKERSRKEDLIELRIVKEMVLKQFHKYLKVFEKK